MFAWCILHKTAYFVCILIFILASFAELTLNLEFGVLFCCCAETIVFHCFVMPFEWTSITDKCSCIYTFMVLINFVHLFIITVNF